MVTPVTLNFWFDLEVELPEFLSPFNFGAKWFSRLDVVVSLCLLNLRSLTRVYTVHGMEDLP